MNFQAKGHHYIKGREGSHLCWPGHVGLFPHGQPHHGGAPALGGPHVAHLGRSAPPLPPFGVRPPYGPLTFGEVVEARGRQEDGEEGEE